MPILKEQVIPNRTLYEIILATFCVIVVVSNIVSAKMIEIPFFNILMPAGLLTYPLTFLICDLVTEVYGTQKAKFMVYVALAMNLLSFAIIQLMLMIPSPNFAEENNFRAVLGLSGLRIFSSLTAYIVAQILDIQMYALIKKWTGFLWI